MRPEFADSSWQSLQAQAHLPDVQEIIRRAIVRDEIRVVPAPGGTIRIIPAGRRAPVQDRERYAAIELDIDDYARSPVHRTQRIAR